MNIKRMIKNGNLKGAIKLLVDEKGSIKEAAEWYGIPYRTLQNWLLGTRKPPEYVVYMMIDMIAKDEYVDSLMQQSKEDYCAYVEDQETMRYLEKENMRLKEASAMLEKALETTIEENEKLKEAIKHKDKFLHSIGTTIGSRHR